MFREDFEEGKGCQLEKRGRYEGEEVVDDLRRKAEDRRGALKGKRRGEGSRHFLIGREKVMKMRIVYGGK